jgi:EAL domain-containing protein (putative c-di-GMP-specific phosphodiesterase class I)
VFSALAASGLPAQRLELEITVPVLLENSEVTPATLHTLRELGVRVVLDDFGTGYSSLGYPLSLRQDPKSTAASAPICPRPARNRRRSFALASLGSSLGMTTTAEGVETSDQVKRVRAEPDGNAGLRHRPATHQRHRPLVPRGRGARRHRR